MFTRYYKKIALIAICLCVFSLFIINSDSYWQDEYTLTGEVVVRFLDVGNADCQIIQLPDGRNIIIDAGKNETEEQLVSDLKKLGIKKFDIVIATHPHEDHIGGMDKIIDNFEIGCIYMPDVVSQTQTFESMLDSIESMGVSVKKAEAGISIIDEEDIDFVILAPNSKYYQELNDYSAVCKLTYKNRSFLFMGDAEKSSELEILRNNMDIEADVLKVGHHGSSSSTSGVFLNRVDPEYGVIEVGKDNSYGHPHDEIISALEHIKVYRTDIHGDVVMVCDGESIDIHTEY